MYCVEATLWYSSHSARLYLIAGPPPES